MGTPDFLASSKNRRDRHRLTVRRRPVTLADTSGLQAHRNQPAQAVCHVDRRRTEQVVPIQDALDGAPRFKKLPAHDARKQSTRQRRRQQNATALYKYVAARALAHFFTRIEKNRIEHIRACGQP